MSLTSADFGKLTKLLSKAIDAAVKREMQGIDRFIKREVETQLREYGESAVRRAVQEAVKQHVHIDVKVGR